MRRRAALAAVALLLGGANGALARSAWPDTPVARLEAFAVIQSLNAELLSRPSATLTLESWCSAHRMADPARVVADRVRDVAKPATEDVRSRLGVDEAEPVVYRRVRLRCGDHVLSEADNWYVPARLTPEMNRALETTDAPFGRVVQPLRFVRRTLSAETPWDVLPRGWDTGDAAIPKASDVPLEAPTVVLKHTAILTLPDGTPFSLVIETYTGSVIAFPRPQVDAE
ncbi:MAG: hypothetical protein DI565_07995 [Ancylobacter novellus]|uniref:Uncharacterized protein n=1 Tax=Ancylobacter novellus TaxID=921 RepID=A0A2W5KJK4_ANCNO|nr:MAG: hypothetical protein DI565_07995 [Ancylobacter novellus]